MNRFVRLSLIWVLILSLLPVQVLAEDHPEWVESLKQIHHFSQSYDRFEQQAEQEYFQADLKEIRKTWPKDLERQYAALLFRQFLSHLDTFQYQVELLTETRKMSSTYKAVFAFDPFPGLRSRHLAMSSSLKNQRFLFDNFMEVVLYSALALSETEKAVPRLEERLVKIQQSSKENKNPKYVEKLQEKLRDYNSWRSMIFDTSPALLFLLHRVQQGENKVPFYTKIKSDYLKFLAQGYKGTRLIQALKDKEYAQITEELKKLEEPVATYSYYATRSFMQKDFHFFLRHFFLRSEIVDQIQSRSIVSSAEKDEFAKLDHKLATNLGIPTLQSLAEPRTVTWTQAGLSFGVSMISAPAGFAVGFNDSLYRYLTAKLDQDAFRIGALTGMNPFALYDSSTKQPYLRILVAETIWMALGSRSANIVGKAVAQSVGKVPQFLTSIPAAARGLLELPSKMSLQASLEFTKQTIKAIGGTFTDPQIVRSAITNSITDATITLGTEGIIRGLWPWELVGEPNMRIRLTSSLIGGFTYAAAIKENWGFARFAFASSVLSLANATTASLLWGEKLNSERLLTNAAYNWLVGAVMMKYMFIPLQDRFLPHIGQQLPKDMRPLLRASRVSQEFLYRFCRGATGTALHFSAVETLLNPVNFRNFYDELYFQQDSSNQTPLAPNDVTLLKHSEAK